jgi:hypothetical protein
MEEIWKNDAPSGETVLEGAAFLKSNPIRPFTGPAYSFRTVSVERIAFNIGILPAKPSKRGSIHISSIQHYSAITSI